MYGERIRGRRVFGSQVTGVRVGVPRNYEIMRLFENGELGTFSDIRTYATNYFTDAGTTPATIGDPIYQINDQSGNGLNWVQGTLTARPILRSDGSGEYLEFDLGDDALSCTLPAGTYKVVVPTREGIWIDEVVHVGGTFTVGPTSYTGGPAGILTALETAGELRLVGPPLIVDASTWTAAKQSALVQWYQNRGAGAELELVDLVDDDFTGYADQSEAESAGYTFGAGSSFDPAGDAISWDGTAPSVYVGITGAIGFPGASDLVVEFTLENYSAGSIMPQTNGGSALASSAAANGAYRGTLRFEPGNYARFAGFGTANVDLTSLAIRKLQPKGA